MFISWRITVLLVIATKLGRVMPKKVPCGTPLDVAFLIDCSRSLKDKEFDMQMSFVKNLTESFDIGPDKTRVAAVTFSDKTNVEFLFNEGQTADVVASKVSNIKHAYGGATNTHDGLDEVLETVFKAGNGERPNFPDVLILLTDGASTNKYKTSDAAKRVKAAKIKIIAIGVGNVNQEELKQLVTEPADETFFYVKQFSDLVSNQLLESVGQKTCVETSTTSTTTIATTTAAPHTTTPDFLNDRPEKECQKKKVDLVFIVDMSTSIWKNHFLQQQQFLADLVDIFDVDGGKTQIALILYTRRARVGFYMNEYDNAKELIESLSSVLRGGSNSNNYQDLKTALDIVFSSKHGARKGVIRTSLLLIDDRNSKRDISVQVGEIASNMGFYLFEIDIGVLSASLGIFNQKKHPRFHSIHDTISQIKQLLDYQPCDDTLADEQIRHCVLTNPTEIMIGLYDIGHSDRKYVKEFIDYLAESTVNVTSGKAKLGIHDECNAFDMDLTEVYFSDDIPHYVNEANKRNAASLLQKMRTSFSRITPAVAKSNRVVILVISGNIRDFDKTYFEALRVKHTAKLIVVGIGEKIMRDQLIELSTSNDKYVSDISHVFPVDNIQDLAVVASKVQKRLC